MSSAAVDNANAVAGQLNAERMAQDMAGRIILQPCGRVTALMMSAIAPVVTLVPLMEVKAAAESTPGLEEYSAIQAAVPKSSAPTSSALRAKA